MVIQTERFPLPGETVRGSEFGLFPGGKGANQAVAVARLGGEVDFLTALGNDAYGTALSAGFANEKINLLELNRDRGSTGVAMVTVDQTGQNQIVIVSGANETLSLGDIDHARSHIKNVQLVIVQLEIPLGTVNYLSKVCEEYQIKLLLNPAPATSLANDLLKRIDIMTPNETELAILTGRDLNQSWDIEQMSTACDQLVSMGVGQVIVTLGEKGAYLHDKDQQLLVRGFAAQVVDTTAAGDVFTAAFAVGITEDKTPVEAIKFAHRAASISVTRLGAQSSIPTRNEVDFLF